ncbi:hypothetical protein ABIB68_004242 [Bradyrhizobium sp. F1.2.2]
MLRVVIPDMQCYDVFYKKLINAVPLKSVTSRFAMEKVDHGAAEPGPDDRVNTHSSQDDYSVRTARTDRPCARSNILFY